MSAILAATCLLAAACTKSNNSPTTPPNSGQPGRGVTAKTISIGFIGLSGFSNSQSTLKTSFGDAQAMAEAAAGYINAHGGIAGRQVKVVFDGVDYSKFAASQSTAAKAACVAMTQDNRVFAVVDLIGPLVTPQCAQQNDTVLIDNEYADTAANIKSFGAYFYAPSSFDLDRQATVYAQGLIDSGFLTKSSKVGVIMTSIQPDSTQQQAVLKNDLEPTLAKQGIKVAGTVAESGGGSGGNELQNFVLQFKSKGIDRVLSLGPNPIDFMSAAQAQGYHPLYGLNSKFGPGAALEQAAPKAQLAGSQAVGWRPLADVDAQHRPANANPNARACQSAQEKAGTLISPAATLFAYSFCDALFMLQTALKGATTVNASILNSRYNSLGTGFQSILGIKTKADASHHEGEVGYRLVTYEGSCSCFQYQGPTYTANE